MIIDKTTVHIPTLRAAIREAERAFRSGYWLTFARTNDVLSASEIRCLGRWGLAKDHGYVAYVTGLYTLRTHLRGKLHRMNPPEAIRQHNAAMRATGRVEQEWCEAKHNRDLAEKFAPLFPMPVVEPVRCEVAEDLAEAASAMPGMSASAIGRTITFTAAG